MNADELSLIPDGIGIAAAGDPGLEKALRLMIPQLCIVLLNRAGALDNPVAVTVKDIDDTSPYVMKFALHLIEGQPTFKFYVEKKH